MPAGLYTHLDFFHAQHVYTAQISCSVTTVHGPNGGTSEHAGIGASVGGILKHALLSQPLGLHAQPVHVLQYCCFVFVPQPPGGATQDTVGEGGIDGAVGLGVGANEQDKLFEHLPLPTLPFHSQPGQFAHDERMACELQPRAGRAHCAIMYVGDGGLVGVVTGTLVGTITGGLVSCGGAGAVVGAQFDFARHLFETQWQPL